MAEHYKSVLVTGGCGFIGANLLPKLMPFVERVRVLDNFSRGRRNYVCGSRIEVIEGDTRDEKRVEEALRGVEAVIHLAAFGSVVESVGGLIENFDVNVRGTVTLLKAAAGHVRKFVFASSGGAVVGPGEPPVNEDSLPKPISPYGASKLCGEAYCHAFAGTFGLSTVSLRFANVYGPFSFHKTSVVTNFIKALTSAQPLVIYGDGSVTRDFIYAGDVCDGIVSSLKTDLTPGTVLHLATGVETSIKELAQRIFVVARCPNGAIRYEKSRPGELERSFATFDRARDKIGFTPNVTLQEGLEQTWSWFERYCAETINASSQ